MSAPRRMRGPMPLPSPAGAEPLGSVVPRPHALTLPTGTDLETQEKKNRFFGGGLGGLFFFFFPISGFS